MKQLITDEVWKDIPGYEGRYQASTHGRIRSLGRYVRLVARGTESKRFVKGRVLKPAGQKRDPHLRVVLEHGGNGQLVHVLVAKTFIGPRPKGCDVRHLDGNPLNNCVDNLAYGSRTENILDVYRQGGIWRKLSLEQIKEIYRRVHNGEKGCDLAKEFGIAEANVSAIKLGRYKSCEL